MSRSFALGFGLIPFLASAVQAQVHADWLQTFDATATGYDEIGAVTIAPSGNVYATGGTGIYPATGPFGLTTAALVLKYDSAGTLQWSRTIQSALYIGVAEDVVVDPSNESVYVVGRVDRDSTHGILALKYDALGSLLWAETFPPQQPQGEFTIARLRANGNLIAAGYAGMGIIVFEYDPQGHLVWSGTVRSGDYPADLTIDSFGNVIVSGSITTSGDNTNFGVSKFSPTGALLWTRAFTGGGRGYEIAGAVLTDSSGAIYAAGRLIDPTGNPHGAVLKLDASGTLLWQQENHGTMSNPPYSAESLHALAFAPGGNVRVEGRTANAGSGIDIQVIEYTPAGSRVWQGTWNGPGNTDEYDIRMTTEADGSMTVLASSEQPSGAYAPVALRWNVDGTLRWADTRLVSSSQRALFYAGAFGSNGTFAIGGRTPGDMISNALVLLARQEALPFCFGDGSSGPCPCSNQAAAGEGQGCVNSLGNAARLTNSGNASLGTDTLALTSSDEIADAFSVFLQGSVQLAPAAFGDGLLCVGGNLLRLYSHNASAGSVSAPAGSDASMSARSAALGDVISAGSTRYYQVYYRDASASFCPPPAGSNFNLSSALSILWVQ
jgi:hypothetical protein